MKVRERSGTRGEGKEQSSGRREGWMDEKEGRAMRKKRNPRGSADGGCSSSFLMRESLGPGARADILHWWPWKLKSLICFVYTLLYCPCYVRQVQLSTALNNKR